MLYGWHLLCSEAGEHVREVCCALSVPSICCQVDRRCIRNESALLHFYRILKYVNVSFFMK